MECSVCLYVGVGVLGHVSLKCLKGSAVTYSLLMVEFMKQEEALILSLHGGTWMLSNEKGAHILKSNK